MSLILGEILQGQTDGTNRVYSTQYGIDTIEEIRVGGAPTLAYTTSGRLITLDVALASGEDNPIINYFDADLNPAVSPTPEVTMQSVLNGVLDIIGLTAFNARSYKESVAIKKVKDCLTLVKTEICEIDLTGEYTFTKGENHKYGTFTRLDLLPVQTRLNNFIPRYGRVMLEGHQIDYITRSDTSFTLTEPTTFTPEGGDLITIGYELPGIVKEVQKVGIGSFFLKRVDSRLWTPLMAYTYTVREGYIYISHNASCNVTVNYIKVKQDLSSTESIIPLDESFQDVLELYAAFNMMRNREDDRWQSTEREYKLRKKQYDAYILRHLKGGIERNKFQGPLNRI